MQPIELKTFQPHMVATSSRVLSGYEGFPGEPEWLLKLSRPKIAMMVMDNMVTSQLIGPRRAQSVWTTA
jgi:hypothetical protein